MRREAGLKSFLARLPLFEGLRPDEPERLAAGTTRQRLRSGEMLSRQGELSTGFHAWCTGASRSSRARQRDASG